jgi:hypothetical protein
MTAILSCSRLGDKPRGLGLPRARRLGPPPRPTAAWWQSPPVLASSPACTAFNCLKLLGPKLGTPLAKGRCITRADACGASPVREFEDYLRCGIWEEGCLHLVCGGAATGAHAFSLLERTALPEPASTQGSTIDMGRFEQGHAVRPLTCRRKPDVRSSIPGRTSVARPARRKEAAPWHRLSALCRRGYDGATWLTSGAPRRWPRSCRDRGTSCTAPGRPCTRSAACRSCLRPAACARAPASSRGRTRKPP